MSLAYFPFYPADYDAKTAHLSLEEDGAYNRLLRLCWVTPGCSIPDDRAWITRRLRVTDETFDRVVSVVIAEFFNRRRGRLYQAKLTKIFEETSAAHKRRVQAGAKGGRPRKPLENNETSETNAKPMLKQPEPEPELYKKEEAKASLRKRASRLSDDWFLPMEWGQWAVSEGMTENEIRAESEKFKDYWHARAGPTASKLDWQATWRNWVRSALERKPQLKAINGGRSDRNRIDPALEQIARLAGLGKAQGDDLF